MREIFLREGVQALDGEFSLDHKVQLLRALVAANVPEIEIGAYVSNSIARNFTDMHVLLRAAAELERQPSLLWVLIPSLVGFERLEEDVKGLSINVGIETISSASDEHSLINVRGKRAEGLDRACAILRVARSKNYSTASYISAAFGYHHNGIERHHLVAHARALVEAGAQRIILADTLGGAVPSLVAEVVRLVTESLSDFQKRRNLDAVAVGVHCHDHRLQALANTVAACQAGATIFDVSIGGIGGYPPSIASRHPEIGRGGNLDSLNGAMGMARHGFAVGALTKGLMEAYSIAGSVPSVQEWKSR